MKRTLNAKEKTLIFIKRTKKKILNTLESYYLYY